MRFYLILETSLFSLQIAFFHRLTTSPKSKVYPPRCSVLWTMRQWDSPFSASPLCPFRGRFTPSSFGDLLFISCFAAIFQFQFRVILLGLYFGFAGFGFLCYAGFCWWMGVFCEPSQLSSCQWVSTVVPLCPTVLFPFLLLVTVACFV